jgi:hypothetical protein
MIELTWGDIRSPIFHQALSKIFQSPLEFKTSLQVMQIIKSINSEKEVANPIWEKHIKENYKKENGVVVGLQETIDSGKEAEALAKIASHSFTIKIPKISVNEVKSITLSPQEIMALAPLFEFNETKDNVLPIKKVEEQLSFPSV